MTSPAFYVFQSERATFNGRKDMTNSKQPTSASSSQRERKMLAAREGEKAMAQYEAESVAVRKNMARLRELRLAREAELPAEVAAPKPAKKKASTAKKGSKNAKTAKAGQQKTLAEFLRKEKAAGRGT